VAGRQEFAKAAPVSLVLVADMEKFGSDSQHAVWMAGVDVGIVCENINLFCSAAGLNTVPRGTMDQKAIQTLLGLTEKQVPVINNPVGYRE
jgi:nitroreductase